jgi:outer membrane receptor protein involved in Fe transport
VLRALSVCAAAALLDFPAAPALAAEPTPLAVDIPAQPLAQALAAFARQTGLQVVYVSGIVRNKKSHAASARLGVSEALTRLLQGTGLHFEYLTPDSIRILAAAPPKTATGISTDGEVEEVVVTANRRSEALQDVPITVEVLTNTTLARLNVSTLDDLVSYLPGVTTHGVGPAQNSIYVRGLGTGEAGVQGSGFSASFPNVAVYLDEQSAQLPGRNLDIYAADLERIEVLQGPQGTLFGAGAQAGVLRYITNRPKLDVTEAMLEAGYATTAHGDSSRVLNGIINIPLIDSKLAARGVIYDDRRGGYIDNAAATFARAPTDVSIAYAGAAGQVPAHSVVINNSSLVGRNVNPVTYRGARVEALYHFKEDWNALLAQSYQRIEADGVFAEMAADSYGRPQPDLIAQLFNPSYDKDRFENTALTVEGRIGALGLLYAGSYLVRNVEQVQDYTNYAHGGLYVDYYQCANPHPDNPAAAQCFTPSSTWRDRERNTHQSHELRFSTPGEWRIRGVGGLFYENYRIEDQTDWFYLTALPYFNPIAPPTGYYSLNGQVVCACTPNAVFVPLAATANNPNVRPPGDGFFNDVTRGYTQRAAYASLDFDLLPQVLTVTAGTRYFSTTSTEVGSSVGSFGCSLLNPDAAPVPNPCVNRIFQNLNAERLSRTYSGFRSRANLSWKVGDNSLLYYTWSQGFRSAGFNRGLGTPASSPLAAGSGSWQTQASAHGGWVAPLAYAPDNLTNNELGWKTSWLNQRLQWDGAVYQEIWDHVQSARLDLGPIVAGDVINGGSYKVRGVETSLVTRALTGLTVEVGAAWNQSELIKEATFLWADGTPVDFSSLRTSTGQQLSNPAGQLGSPLAGAPSFQGNVRVRYEFALNGYNLFAQAGVVHQSHSLASTDRLSLDPQGSPTGYDLPPFTTYNGALGVGEGSWLVQVYGENLTDTRAELYANHNQWYKAVTVNRPRTIGLRLSYKFNSE